MLHVSFDFVIMEPVFLFRELAQRVSMNLNGVVAFMVNGKYFHLFTANG